MSIDVGCSVTAGTSSAHSASSQSASTYHLHECSIRIISQSSQLLYPRIGVHKEILRGIDNRIAEANTISSSEHLLAVGDSRSGASESEEGASLSETGDRCSQTGNIYDILRPSRAGLSAGPIQPMAES